MDLQVGNQVDLQVGNHLQDNHLQDSFSGPERLRTCSAAKLAFQMPSRLLLAEPLLLGVRALAT